MFQLFAAAQKPPAGLISTNGDGAIGLEAYSLGGGGGDAGMNFMVSGTTGGARAKRVPPRIIPGRERLMTK